ncbi:hypothetical protein Sulac_2298 [Sulfobacillus acidophilus DSM 10332]|uniref:Uncharacterized protein n=1 Tax=Sulfobacillus acidophilus (strain ATCC 700253 / DSM 10332 / NAL) TaxID=679936 RepID=G8TU95_SULAD|nr:hypothetical protein Sulac_2298 [Sulfobacillus acidophilus DSM 10332]
MSHNVFWTTATAMAAIVYTIFLEQPLIMFSRAFRDLSRSSGFVELHRQGQDRGLYHVN